MKGKALICDGRDTVLSELLGTAPTALVWSALWCMHGVKVSFSKQMLAEEAGISRPALYKVFNSFLKYEWIIEHEVVKGKQTYRLNEENYIVREMVTLMDIFVHTHNEIVSAEAATKDKLARRFRK
jgi:hypothetical protein